MISTQDKTHLLCTKISDVEQIYLYHPLSHRDGVENGIDWMVRCVKRNIYRPAHTKYELA